MATYQFYIELIPTRWLRDNSIEFLYTKNDTIDTYEVWELNQPTIDFESIIKKIMPRGPSWCSDINIWGDEKDSNIQVIREGSKIESIAIRIDMRRDIQPVLSNILNLALELKCSVFVPEMKVCINPSLTEIKPLMQKSASFEFCPHPDEFLESSC